MNEEQIKNKIKMYKDLLNKSTCNNDKRIYRNLIYKYEKMLKRQN